MPTTKKGVMERRQVTLVTLDPKKSINYFTTSFY